MVPALRDRRDDSGIALVIVIGAIALMVVLATAGFYVTSQTLFQTRLADQHDVAFQAASSGVMIAFADLRAQLAARPAGGTYTGSIATSAAVYTAVAALNAAQTAYDCTSTGTSADGTREIIVSTFSIGAGTGSTGTLWGKDVFFGGQILGTITGNGQIIGPMYLKFPGSASQNTLDFGSAAAGFTAGPIYIENADLILKNTPPVPIDIYTNGTITLEGSLKNNPQMIINHGWDPSYVIPLVPLNASAYLANALQAATAESSDNKMGSGSSTAVNYESQPVSSPASYTSLSTTPPNNRPSGWVRSRATGASQAYKVIPTDLTLDSSTRSFGSWSGDGHYPTTPGLHDDFAYDAANGVLYVEGTVYVGGNFTVDKSLKYVGSGTIVCAGNAIFHSSLVPATADGPDGTPDPTAGNILGVFSAGNVVIDRNNTVVTAALYTTSQLNATANNVTLKGSFISENGVSGFPNGLNLIAFPTLATYVPSGLPTGQTGSGGSSGSGGTTILSIAAWRRL